MYIVLCMYEKHIKDVIEISSCILDEHTKRREKGAEAAHEAGKQGLEEWGIGVGSSHLNFRTTRELNPNLT